MLINRPVSDGDWHHVTWTRRYKHITLTLDGTSTGQADLPGADTEFSAAQDPVISIDIGGLPAGVTQAKGKLLFAIFESCLSYGSVYYHALVREVKRVESSFSSNLSGYLVIA